MRTSAIVWAGAALIALAIVAAPRGCVGCDESYVVPVRAEPADAAPEATAFGTAVDEPELVAADRSTAEALDDPPEPAPASPEDEPGTGSLSGRLLLVDGNPLPLQALLARQQVRDGLAAEDTTSHRERTDLAGHFEFEHLPRVPYTLSMQSVLDIPAEDSLHTPSESDCRLYVDGYALLVQALDPGGRALSGARIRLDPSDAVGPGGVVLMFGRTNVEGYAAFVFAQPIQASLLVGRDELSARAEIDFSTGASRLIRLPLTLSLPEEVGRVEVRLVTQTGTRLLDYSVLLADARSGSKVRLLNSWECDSDGTFSGIPVGRHVAELKFKYYGDPGFYLSNDEEVELEVTSGAQTTIEFDVIEGGRIRLYVEDPAETPAGSVEVMLTDERGEDRSVDVVLPGPDDYEVTITGEVPVGVYALNQRVLSPGLYTLTAEASDGRRATAEVIVRPGRVVEALLRF